MKRWVTGEEEEMEQEDIDRVLFKLGREWMSVSKLRKLPAHVVKETDVAVLRVPKTQGYYTCPIVSMPAAGFFS
jgi:hypothetical protein